MNEARCLTSKAGEMDLEEQKKESGDMKLWMVKSLVRGRSVWRGVGV